jgi:hypothetical protein
VCASPQQINLEVIACMNPDFIKASFLPQPETARCAG